MTRRLAAVLALDAAGFTARMAADADAALAGLRRVLRETVRPEIRRRHGRVFKLTGDGAPAEFHTAGDAILAAAGILRALRDDPVRLRAGVHAGDVTEEDGDLYGDAVNLAARLQAAAAEGGGLVSRTAADLAGGGLGVALRPEGARRFKGVERPVEVLSLDLDAGGEAVAARLAAGQEIRFASSADGTRLAWTAIGAGPPLVKAPNWVQHLEADWGTLYGGLLADLAARRRLVRFDQRGNGLSDRGAPELSLERFVDDLEAVFDASGVERAPVIAFSQGCPTAAAFAVRRPERVSGLVLIGGFAQGPAVRDEPRHAELVAALDAMGKVGWDDDFPSIRDHFARILVPDATEEDRRAYAERMREMIEPEEFGRFREAIGRIDVSDRLGAVRCPALMLHAVGDRQQPVEQGRRLAAGIPDARFVALQTRNHVPPVYDPAWPVALREIDAFLDALA